MDTQGNSTQKPISDDTNGNEEVSRLRSFKKDSEAIKEGKDYRFTSSDPITLPETVQAGDLGIKELSEKEEAKPLPTVPLSYARTIHHTDGTVPAKEETLRPEIHTTKKVEIKPEIKKMRPHLPVREKTWDVLKEAKEQVTKQTEESSVGTSPQIQAIQNATHYVKDEIEREAKKLEELEIEEAKLEERNNIGQQEVEILRKEQETLTEEKKLEEGELERLKREKLNLEREKEVETEAMSEVERELKRVKLEKRHQEEELKALKESQINLESRKKEIDAEKKRQAEILQELQIVKEDLSKAEEYISRAKKDIEHNQNQEVESYTEGKTETVSEEHNDKPVETLKEAYSTESADPIEREREEIEKIKKEIAERKKKQQEELEALRRQRSGESLAEKKTEEPVKRNTDPEFSGAPKKQTYSADPYREPLEE